jgi:catechol 2,3-dioxygenase-like lactoylglutathione lyase family enzyme
VIDHFGVNCADYAKSQQFYDRVLGVLGYSRQMDVGEAFHEAAVALGAESLHAPRLWPEYHPGYFGAFVRDPDGNNVEAVCHGTAGGDH